MKVAFSKEKKYVPDFNGNKELPEAEQLVAYIKPLKSGEVIDLTDVLKEAGFEKGDSKQMSSHQMKTVVQQAGHYLPTYVRLEGNDGFTIQDVADYTPFLALATELLFVLMNFSSPNQDDVKNS